MKKASIVKDLMKKLEPLKKLNEALFVSVRMRSPVINPHPTLGSWFPIFDVPADEVQERINEGYSFVFRQVEQAKKV